MLSRYIPKGFGPKLRGIDGGGSHGTIPGNGYEGTYYNVEANLDFEAAIPLIYPQSTVLFQVDDPVIEQTGDYSGFLNNFFDGIDGSYCTYSAYGLSGNSPGIDPPYPDPAPGGL